jgi:hypothetical protein
MPALPSPTRGEGAPAWLAPEEALRGAEAAMTEGAVAFIATGISGALLSVAPVAALALWALVRGQAA